jgi:hypothetical protein
LKVDLPAGTIIAGCGPMNIRVGDVDGSGAGEIPLLFPGTPVNLHTKITSIFSP